MPQPKTAVIVTLGILGWVISWLLFYRWLGEHQWDFFGGWREAFTASDFATGLIMDLVLTSAMLIALALFERERLGPRWTAAVILSLAISVSISLTLYLVACWLRSAEEQAAAPPAANPGST